jgi:Glu-tRNA(Gln) amidotransferase subunit E-like FAD-binding protein
MVESCDPSDYPRFGKLSEKTIKEKAGKLLKWLWDSDTDIPRNRLSVSDDCIENIIDLVERRRVYLYVFHGIEMSEWNEIALYCFWINKLHPFFEIPQSKKIAIQVNDINARIAVRMLRHTIARIRRANNKPKIGYVNLNNLLHTFRFRDLSKEAVMSIFESLLDK